MGDHEPISSEYLPPPPYTIILGQIPLANFRSYLFDLQQQLLLQEARLPLISPPREEIESVVRQRKLLMGAEEIYALLTGGYAVAIQENKSFREKDPRFDFFRGTIASDATRIVSLTTEEKRGVLGALIPSERKFPEHVSPITRNRAGIERTLTQQYVVAFRFDPTIEAFPYVPGDLKLQTNTCPKISLPASSAATTPTTA